MEKLEIMRGGTLEKTSWVYNEQTETGKYVTTDVTPYAISMLYENCVLEDGVTLKDVFLLLNTNLTMFDTVIGNWCKDIVEEGLSNPGKPYDLTDDEAIEFLELHWHIGREEWDGKKSISGYAFPWLHGLGVERKQTSYHNWNDDDGNPVVEYEKGSRTHWGVSFSPAYDLINIPIKLNEEFLIYNEQDHTDTVTYEGPTFTLGHIIYGLIWELTWNGSPDMRNERRDELNSAVEEIENGTAELVSVDELFDELDKDEKSS